MKKFAALLSLLLAFTVVLAACGSSAKNEANNRDNKSSQEDVYNKVKKMAY